MTDFEGEVIRRVRAEELTEIALGRIAVQLREAKLEVDPDLFAVMSERLDAPLPFETELPDLPGLLETLAQEFGDDPFNVVRGMTEVTYAMPTEARVMVAEYLLAAPHSGLREAVPLMVLDDRLQVRRAVTEVLLRIPKAVSRSGLRRLIALRNWLPAEERPQVDKVVKAARRQGVECASCERGPPVEIRD